MKVKRKIIAINEELCDGCGQCAIACAEGAIKIIDGKAKVISDNLCDGLGACIGDCPQGALKIVERETEEFDEDAVEKHLGQQKKAAPIPNTLACGCPSTQIQEFSTETTRQSANKSVSLASEESALSHWPVQIRLVPPNAPFLKGADLLVAADCVSVAYSAFHRDFLKGKKVMIGCPKFDDKESCVEKFAEIFKIAGIKSITCLIMEVPCCSGLPGILNKAMEKAGITVSVEKIIISNRGKRI
ncbi:MAG: 4Fe-4S binding protein [Deltaproteobacteria bacterium]|nr:4Fe-4S binding protein [Deltaproteobacteria bacterium]